jgi:hypothetical protein
MARDRLQGRLWRRDERLAMLPRVVDGRQKPEVALGIPHDPLLMGLRDKEGYETLWSTVHVGLLWSMGGQSTRPLDLTLSPVVPNCSAACSEAANVGVSVCRPSKPSHLL